MKAAVEAKRQAGWTGALPADALTTSASGLDPDISPENALAPGAAVAKARGLDEEKLRKLVLPMSKGRCSALSANGASMCSCSIWPWTI